MYINLLYLPLFNFAYLFFLSSQHFVSFIFIALFPNWHLVLVLFSSLCFSYFCPGRYNFWFPLFANLLYFIFVGLSWSCLWVYMYLCYSVMLFIVAINVCLWVGILQLCGVSFFSLFSFFFHFFFFVILIFNYFKRIIFFLHLFFCLPFLLFFSPCS